MEPIVNFFSKDTSQAANLIGHSLFLLFNTINVSYLVLVQWFALKQLHKSTLLQLALAGCFLQGISCTSSVARWNVGDPTSAHFGIPSAIFGILGQTLCNMAYIALWFHRTEQQTLKMLGWTFFSVLGGALAVITYVKWDYTGASFMYLILYGLSSSIWHIVSVWRFRGEHKDGKVSISESTASSSSISRILAVAIFLEALALCLEKFTTSVFPYIGSGIHYSSTVLVMVYASGIDHTYRIIA